MMNFTNLTTKHLGLFMDSYNKKVTSTLLVKGNKSLVKSTYFDFSFLDSILPSSASTSTEPPEVSEPPWVKIPVLEDYLPTTTKKALKPLIDFTESNEIAWNLKKKIEYFILGDPTRKIYSAGTKPPLVAYKQSKEDLVLLWDSRVKLKTSELEPRLLTQTPSKFDDLQTELELESEDYIWSFISNAYNFFNHTNSYEMSYSSHKVDNSYFRTLVYDNFSKVIYYRSNFYYIIYYLSEHFDSSEFWFTKDRENSFQDLNTFRKCCLLRRRVIHRDELIYGTKVHKLRHKRIPHKLFRKFPHVNYHRGGWRSFKRLMRYGIFSSIPYIRDITDVKDFLFWTNFAHLWYYTKFMEKPTDFYAWPRFTSRWERIIHFLQFFYQLTPSRYTDLDSVYDSFYPRVLIHSLFIESLYEGHRFSTFMDSHSHRYAWLLRSGHTLAATLEMIQAWRNVRVERLPWSFQDFASDYWYFYGIFLPESMGAIRPALMVLVHKPKPSTYFHERIIWNWNSVFRFTDDPLVKRYLDAYFLEKYSKVEKLSFFRDQVTMLARPYPLERLTGVFFGYNKSLLSANVPYWYTELSWNNRLLASAGNMTHFDLSKEEELYKMHDRMSYTFWNWTTEVRPKISRFFKIAKLDDKPPLFLSYLNEKAYGDPGVFKTSLQWVEKPEKLQNFLWTTSLRTKRVLMSEIFSTSSYSWGSMSQLTSYLPYSIPYLSEAYSRSLLIFNTILKEILEEEASGTIYFYPVGSTWTNYIPLRYRNTTYFFSNSITYEVSIPPEVLHAFFGPGSLEKVLFFLKPFLLWSHGLFEIFEFEDFKAFFLPYQQKILHFFEKNCSYTNTLARSFTVLRNTEFFVGGCSINIERIYLFIYKYIFIKFFTLESLYIDLTGYPTRDGNSSCFAVLNSVDAFKSWTIEPYFFIPGAIWEKSFTIRRRLPGLLIPYNIKIDNFLTENKLNYLQFKQLWLSGALCSLWNDAAAVSFYSDLTARSVNSYLEVPRLRKPIDLQRHNVYVLRKNLYINFEKFPGNNLEPTSNDDN